MINATLCTGTLNCTTTTVIVANYLQIFQGALFMLFFYVQILYKLQYLYSSSPSPVPKQKDHKIVKIPGQGGKGRVYPHQHITDDVGAILGAEFKLPDNYKEKYQETIHHDMSDICRRDYRNRLEKQWNFGKKTIPRYFMLALYVKETNQQDKSKHFFKGKFKQDLKYKN